MIVNPEIRRNRANGFITIEWRHDDETAWRELSLSGTKGGLFSRFYDKALAPGAKETLVRETVQAYLDEADGG